MVMKNVYKIGLVLSLALNVILVYRFFIAGNTVKNETDNRIAIELSEKNRDFVMFEMRTFLEGVKHIHDGIQTGDYEKIEKNASKSGMSVENHVPGELLRSLPIEFKKLGFNTHDRFDKIAELARQKAKKEVLNQELSGLMNNCVSCHASFKINIKK